MKRWIFWILLLILTVGAIALAIVLLWGSGSAELQPEKQTEVPEAQNEEPADVPQETDKPETNRPEVTEKPAATEKPKAATEPTGTPDGEKTSPTPAPTDSGDTKPVTSPSPTPAPVVPAGDEDELPLMP